jgi:oxygen-independent coproporphyrinogen III oxidase
MIYIHVPFCKSFCTYCDFYSETVCAGKGGRVMERWADELIAEIRSRRSETDATLSLNTLYIGGGTPSVLPPVLLGRIVEALPGRPYDEFTVEVNPDDIVEKGPDYIMALRALGVNRISMGVQSLDDGILRWMNRRHDAARAREAFRLLREGGFDNISVDLIFGFPMLTVDILARTLEEIISWRPEHISAYQLSIEEGSALAQMASDGRFSEAPETLCVEQYAAICSALSAAGYRHYEISNWALPSREARHNSAYWTRRPYVGFGPGAHSFDGARRRANSQTLSGWTPSFEILTPQEEREERIMLGLRTAGGIAESLCDAGAVERLIAEGALVRTGNANIRIPEERFFVSDGIIEELI